SLQSLASTVLSLKFVSKSKSTRTPPRGGHLEHPDSPPRVTSRDGAAPVLPQKLPCPILSPFFWRKGGIPSHSISPFILSGVWSFFGQTESKDLRLLFATYAANFWCNLVRFGRQNKRVDQKRHANKPRNQPTKVHRCIGHQRVQKDHQPHANADVDQPADLHALALLTGLQPRLLPQQFN